VPVTVSIFVIATVGALLVPDFSPGLVSLIIIQLIVPLLIAGAALVGISRGRIRIAGGLVLTVTGVTVHAVTSAALYRVQAGYAAFHDGVTVPITFASATLQMLVAGLVFALGARRSAEVGTRDAV
jgi:hypothetical protein